MTQAEARQELAGASADIRRGADMAIGSDRNNTLWQAIGRVRRVLEAEGAAAVEVVAPSTHPDAAAAGPLAVAVTRETTAKAMGTVVPGGCATGKTFDEAE